MKMSGKLLKVTRVVSAFVLYPCRLDLESLRDLCSPSITDPLFPNLRRLSYFIANQNFPLVHHVVSPTLNINILCFTFAVSNISSSEGFIRSLGPTRLNVKKVNIICSPTLDSPGDIMVLRICHWSNLREVDCTMFRLYSNALLRLNSFPGLTVLSFTPSDQLLVLSPLQRLSIRIECLVPIPSYSRMCDVRPSRVYPLSLPQSLLQGTLSGHCRWRCKNPVPA